MATGDIVEFLRKEGKIGESEITAPLCEDCRFKILSQLTRDQKQIIPANSESLTLTRSLQTVKHLIPRVIMQRDISGRFSIPSKSTSTQLHFNHLMEVAEAEEVHDIARPSTSTAPISPSDSSKTPFVVKIPWSSPSAYHALNAKPSPPPTYFPSSKPGFKSLEDRLRELSLQAEIPARNMPETTFLPPVAEEVFQALLPPSQRSLLSVTANLQIAKEHPKQSATSSQRNNQSSQPDRLSEHAGLGIAGKDSIESEEDELHSNGSSRPSTPSIDSDERPDLDDRHIPVQGIKRTQARCCVCGGRGRKYSLIP
ncbi:hypothetical protein Fcan01_11330 [Folsomia candida]|uniref:Uncharacterized protein n=1 Tax=Folsomia candida TaxID=158441 RepID=A0A226EAB4_FOLCA|nr:hypothetical protein Fcan01_11330 [Folsomia candida]